MATASAPYIVPLGGLISGSIEGHFDWVFNDSATVFTDISADCDDTATTGGVITGASGDHLYLGCTTDKFDGAAADMNTLPTVGTRTWEYWNGAWTALTTTVHTGNVNLTADSSFSFTPPTDWVTTTINAQSAYWIRGRVTGVYTIAGTVTTIRAARYIKVVDALTLYHAATTSRVWNSAAIRFGFVGHSTGCAYQRIRVWVQLGAAAITLVSDEAGPATSGEHFADMIMANATSYFESNFGTGTSQTINVWVTTLQSTASTSSGTGVGGTGTCCYTVMLFGDVGYNTSNTTITKTVAIPLESGIARLTNALAEIGTNQIPILTGGGSPFLPESSITVRQTAFWIQAVHATNSSTDFALAVALDAEAETLFDTQENNGNTGKYFEQIWVKSFTTTATHAFKARSTVTTTILSPAVILYVVYDCDPTSATQLVSRFIPHRLGNTLYIPSGSTTPDITSGSIVVPESGSVTLKQSAVLGWHGKITDFAASTNFYVAFGAQTHRVYAEGTGICGTSGPGIVFTQRIDSGGAQGAGISLAHGWNQLNTSCYHTLNSDSTEFMGFVILNYHASKPGSGEHLMARTKIVMISGRATTGARVEYTIPASMIPHTNYWINAMAVWFQLTAQERGAYRLNIRNDDSPSGMPSPALSDVFCPHIETGPIIAFWDLMNANFNFINRMFKIHPSDPLPHAMDINTTRIFQHQRESFTASARTSMMLVIDYHGITWTKAMDVSQYAGGGSGLAVDVYHKNSDQLIYTATTGASGDLQLTGYDGAETYFAVCREDATHNGRSNDFVFDNT